MSKETNEINFLNLVNKIFEDKNEYFKKNNLLQFTKDNTWEKNKLKLTELLNAN